MFFLLTFKRKYAFEREFNHFIIYSLVLLSYGIYRTKSKIERKKDLRKRNVNLETDCYALLAHFMQYFMQKSFYRNPQIESVKDS